mmetsp:Transcript_64841/g.193227  ORF Transcript_64841/g.193227 Transcript_64841/m.193227 type:complete len:230 (+) Transcript_64841:69-758(+)
MGQQRPCRPLRPGQCPHLRSGHEWPRHRVECPDGRADGPRQGLNYGKTAPGPGSRGLPPGPEGQPGIFGQGRDGPPLRAEGQEGRGWQRGGGRDPRGVLATVRSARPGCRSSLRRADRAPPRADTAARWQRLRGGDRGTLGELEPEDEGHGHARASVPAARDHWPGKYPLPGRVAHAEAAEDDRHQRGARPRAGHEPHGLLEPLGGPVHGPGPGRHRHLGVGQREPGPV